MSDSASFGDWIRRRRRALDLTREALARQVGCAVVTIRKIETDERRPSRQIAERLADCLLIPPTDRAAFVHAARAELAVDRLPHPPSVIDVPSPGPAAVASDRSPPSSASSQEERRWATVLFASISGYTSVSERMDVEDVQAIVVRGIEQIDAQIRRFGGTVINVMGDAVLAVFGAPQAHEDDATRAVRAAIALRDSPLLVAPRRPLQLHIGINTGEVLATSHGPQEGRNYSIWGIRSIRPTSS